MFQSWKIVACLKNMEPKALINVTLRTRGIQYSSKSSIDSRQENDDGFWISTVAIYRLHLCAFILDYHLSCFSLWYNELTAAETRFANFSYMFLGTKENAATEIPVPDLFPHMDFLRLAHRDKGLFQQMNIPGTILYIISCVYT